MNKLSLLIALLSAWSFFSCNKNNGTDTLLPEETYSLQFQNEFNELQAKIAVILSDSDGKVMAAQWLPGDRATQVTAPAVPRDQKLDCTVLRMQIVQAAGSNVRDTTVQIATYTQTPSGRLIQLRNLFYERSTSLQIQFNNVNSVDSLRIPDAITFFQPQPSNSFFGQYQVQHTGRLWLRLKINGEKDWRFLVFNNVNQPILAVPAFPPTILPFIFAKPKNIQTPFAAPWVWRVDGLVDTTRLEFLAFGPMALIPGNATPVLTSLPVFEPIANEDFDPAPKVYRGFRVKAEGQGPAYGYYIDRFYDDVPTQLPLADFDLLSVGASDQRQASARCVGQFNNVVFTRQFSRPTYRLSWEVYCSAEAGAVVTYRLPDIPDLVANSVPRLRNYAFAPGVRARAERYANLTGYEQVLTHLFYNNNALWKPRANYLAIEHNL